MEFPKQSLMDLVPPPPNAIETQGDWAQVEQHLGTALPDDYKLFISVYGSGTICDTFIYILNPFASDKYWNLLKYYQGALARYQEAIKEGTDRVNPYPVYPESGGILPWGISANGHEMFWFTGGEPNSWGIVFKDSDLIECRFYEKICMT